MNIVLKEIFTNLEPFDIYSSFKEEINVIFLDSGKDKETLGRYSFIGINPFLTIKGSCDNYTINGECSAGNIFEKLRELLNKYKCTNHTGIPFIGGCIGYFSYDFGLELDDIKHNGIQDLELPHYYFNFYDNLIIFDRKYNKSYISACGILKDSKQSIEDIEKKVLSSSKVIYTKVKSSNAKLSSNFTKEDYIRTVTRVKNYIKSGDIYITNLTQRFNAYTSKNSYDIYKDLRHINPAPFAAFMKLDGFDVISSSPERFIKIENGLVETRPIKGTRPRGSTPEEDEANKSALINSDKDKAELLMIVDLQRNDLSKVCMPHSVEVTELFKLEEYSTVFHLVSTVKGKLKDNIDSVKCMENCFPGGSITGTPKIRAMEIIDELEGIKRNIYTGSIGYFGFDGNADFNIVIRTMVKINSKVYFGVGGGITWDSDEEAEYEETLDKAQALIRVI